LFLHGHRHGPPLVFLVASSWPLLWSSSFSCVLSCALPGHHCGHPLVFLVALILAIVMVVVVFLCS
jgi:hypothetical protein